MVNTEKWKNIKGYEGIYQVSNLGRIKSLERMEKYKNTQRKRKEKILKGINLNGYIRIGLLKNKKYKNFLVHRLVATTFIPNPNNFKEINHKDGNKQNNEISNLEWCTRSENVKHAYNTKLKEGRKGTKNGRAKFTTKEIEEIRNVYKYKDKNCNTYRIAEKYNVSEPTILNIIKGKTWR